ncbi:autotransporter outer membrane beta-barrel domain-containing protein [Hoeflea sp.]|uniref:autotransporter outer membrane beta-barrel domain-containing protein n=1 Tax=Hoeflea sp. TaxID=1940281 RepID=UPI003A8F1E11
MPKFVLLASTAFTALSGTALAGLWINADVTVDGIDGGPYGKVISETDFVSVGVKDPASLTISRGGTVTAPIANIGTNEDGTATITGAGSRWYDFVISRVGWNAEGVLTIKDSGLMSGKDMVLGESNIARGTVNLSGSGSKLLLTGALSLGDKGTGTLNLSDGGTVEAVSSVFGKDTGGSGTAIVSGAGTTWTSTGGLLVIGDEGSGVLTLADSANVVANDRVDIAKASGSTGTLNIGAAAGEKATSAGTLQTGAVVFGVGDGSIVFNHTDTAYDFKANLSGTGTLKIMNGGTILSGDNSAFTGSTEISSGLLSVNGTLGGTISVADGGTIGGSGTIGGLTANSGTTVAPGNSIGTLNVTGNAVFAAGSTYAVEVDNAGNSDKIAATGSVTIHSGATVSVSAENGTDNGSTYAPSTTYTIITAGTAVTGMFGSVSENFAFLDAALGYTASAVTLTLTRNASSFASVGRTANQRAVAKGVSSLTAGNAVYDAAIVLSADGARTAFDSLSGEIYPSTTGRFILDSRFARNAASNRIRSAFEGLDVGAMPMTSFGGSGDALNVSGGAAVWGQAYGGWGNTRGNGNAAAMGHSTGGLLFGADAELFGGWRSGLMAGYGNAGFNVGPRSSSGNADSYTFGAYAGGQFGSLGVRLGASYALHDVSTSRNVTVGTLSNALSADYTASTSQVFGEAGYSFNTPLARFEPFAGFALIHQRSGAFTESGGAAALSVASTMQTLGFTTLGLRAERQVAVGEGYTATVSGSLGWSHVIGDPDPASTMRFAGGNAFRISGTPIDRDTAQLGAGLQLRFANEANLDVDYIGELGARTESHAVAARFSKAF